MAKKTTKVTKTVTAKSNIVEGADCRLLINVYSPGHEPKELRVTIPAITGKTNINSRKPEDVIAAVISGLQITYGGKVS